VEIIRGITVVAQGRIVKDDQSVTSPQKLNMSLTLRSLKGKKKTEA
jgi:hypothetical protein